MIQVRDRSFVELVVIVVDLSYLSSVLVASGMYGREATLLRTQIPQTQV